jgi:hypothetical protein
MPVVLDTNILVSALLSPFGPPARVLDLVLNGDIRGNPLWLPMQGQAQGTAPTEFGTAA